MNRRVSLLESLVAARHTGTPPPELCVAFDEAAEFAMCEGRSITEAVDSFFSEEDWGPAQKVLADLVRPRTVFRPASLPVMPKAASRLLKTNDEKVTVDELEHIAASDPVLAARLLAASNSARHGSRFEIIRLRDAVLRLGVPESRKVLIAACIGGVFASTSLRELWEHSQVVAAAAQGIAELCDVDPDSAWLGGLLHDIGRLGLATAPTVTQCAVRRWQEADFPLVYAESLVFGLDHAALGGRLLEAWEIPEAVVAAVGGHHRPETAHTGLAAVLFLAEDAPFRVFGSLAEDLWPELRRRVACDEAGIHPDKLREWDEGTLRRHRATA